MDNVAVMVRRTRVIVVVAIPLLLLSLLVLRKLVERTIIAEDSVLNPRHMIIENWSGDEKLFAPAKDFAERYGVKHVATIIVESSYVDSFSRREFLDAAWDAGFDTTTLRLIPVPMREPKTLNIAEAAVDSAFVWGWKEITVATAELHTARSRKSYLLEAKRYGMQVRVVGLPYNNVSSDNWYRTGRGLIEATSELSKLIYYEIAVF